MGNRSLIHIICFIVFLHCAPKPFSWQGQYIKINTTEQPKEDFIVDDYIVIGYAPCVYKKNATRLYKFALIKNGQQVGLITLDQHDFITTMYYLEESDYSRNDKLYWISRTGNHITYNMYKTRPTYEKVKQDVTILLYGGELIPEVGNEK
ncbi:MAG: hypothetical protein WBB67_11425 [bacterium]